MNIVDSVKQAIFQTKTKIPFANLMAFIEVESGGKAFDKSTGRLIIQFEPHWFKKKAPYAPSGAWSVNKVDVQSKEWIAFNDAAKYNREAAIESTSLGLPQIMGFHFKRLGYSSASEMFSDFMASEINQIKALIKFIETDAKLAGAMNKQDWHTVASIYNGAGYLELAKRLGREPYNITLRKSYDKYK